MDEKSPNFELPIHEALPELKARLAASTAVVLIAPPGAGKTTVAPLALMDQPWVGGRKLIMLEPRRLAARAAAERMARTLGEPVGRTVGYRVRLQSKVSGATRIEVVTEGVFTRMILDDPGLDGVACVVFDEFHERSLDSDLGLAFARDAQLVLREDLRLLVMSATLDGAAIANLLDAPVVRSEGRAFPVDTHYLGRDPAVRIEDQAARAVRRALADETGSMLVFLPGAGEIRRVEALLAERLAGRADVRLAPLYGALTSAEQDRAIAPAPPGVRKIVLATSIAETSLTIEGVRVVVDCGLSRVPRYAPSSGLTRLETVRVSRAGADQRRGRAGRTEPGVCYRLWDEAETRALPAFGRPEMLESDLSGVALDLAQWGCRDPAGLALLDPPPIAAFAEARGLLTRLGGLDAHGELTAHGRRLASLPLAPRLAHLVIEGAGQGGAGRAALIAAVLSERGLGGTATDLSERLERFAADFSPRARDARTLAERWARSAAQTRPNDGTVALLSDGVLLARAYPERIAQARGAPGEFRLASGRGAYLDPGDRLARETWLAVGELGGGGTRDRILLAAPLDEASVLSLFADQIVAEDRVETDANGRLRAMRVSRLGELTIESRRIERPDAALLATALLDRVRAVGLGDLPWSEAAGRLRARVAFLRALQGEVWPDLSDEALTECVGDWLAPLLEGRAAMAQVSSAALEQALRDMVPWDLQRRLDADAPERFKAPTGSAVSIDYAAEGGPRVEVRVQELFGLDRHPTIGGGRTALTLALLSPARRPVQVTRDLPGFWAGSWKAVRSEMKGRYPRHPWPDDPLQAAPTTRAKPRGT